jgi:hypothetical protein
VITLVYLQAEKIQSLTLSDCSQMLIERLNTRMRINEISEEVW